MADASLIARQLLSDLRRDFGLTDAQAAGVVGNLMHESGNFEHLQEINPVVPGARGGWGFAQWTGQRRKSFDNYVEREGLDPGSYEANYGFLKHEVANNRYERGNFNQIKKAETAEEAARIFSKEYLRPGTPHMGSRLQYTATAAELAALPPLPPGSIPNVVGTELDTKRNAVPKSYATNDFGRMVNTATGAFLPPSSPVMQSISAGRQAIDNTRPQEYPNARTVMLPPIAPSKLRNSTAVPRSIIERGVPQSASVSKSAPQSIIERGVSRAPQSIIAGRNAGDAIALSPVMGGKQNPIFDAGYDTEQGVMQRFQSPVGEMPTLEGTRAAFHLPPMRSILGEPPATRSVPSIAVTAPLAGPRDGIDKGPGVFANIASILGASQPTAASSGGRQPPVMAPYSNPLTASDRARLAQNAPKAAAPREMEVSLGDVMSPRYPNAASAEPGPTWAEFTGMMHSPRIPGLDAPIKAGERLPRVAALSFEPRAAAPAAAPPPAYKGPFVPAAAPAPTYRTVMRDAQIENPAYTAWKAANLHAPGNIPLGEVSHPLSRDSVAQAAAGANYVATKMPEQFLTVQRPVQVRVAPPVQPLVAQPAIAVPRSIITIKPPAAPFGSGGLFGALASGAQSTLGAVQGGINSILGNLVADQKAGKLPVGSYLGPAANGGAMFQGHNGVLNNLTQNSDWWQVVTGQSDRSRGDGVAQSLSGTQNR